MNTQVTLTLKDAIYRRAELLAQLTDSDVTQVLADTIEQSLSPLSLLEKAEVPLTTLSDEEVLSLSEIQMTEAQDRLFSTLLDKQQAGTLTEAENVELWALMQQYQEGLLQKAHALREAVQRGLREPLEP